MFNFYIENLSQLEPINYEEEVGISETELKDIDYAINELKL